MIAEWPISEQCGATFAQMSLSIFVIFVRNVPSIGRISKEIERYFERGPEIQKVVKKHTEYNVFVKVGPASGKASQKRFQRKSESLELLKEASKYSTFVIFVKNERSVGRNS